jgi:LPXTG-site transpeptidase (sortase) family protein
VMTPTPIPSVKGVRLVIPSIKVNAPIEPVGIASNGTLAVPVMQPWTDTGWYKYGPYPGLPGSSVIDGHLNRPGGCCIPAVFWNLKLMHVGDSVMVTSPGGKVLHFRVTAIKTLKNDAPTADIFNRVGGTYLNLITCAGDWIVSQHQTTLRLVVYTILV